MAESTASTPSRRNEMLRLLALWIIAASLVLLSGSVAYTTFVDPADTGTQVVVQPAQPQIVVQPAEPQVHVEFSLSEIESRLLFIDLSLGDINSTLRTICRALGGFCA